MVNSARSLLSLTASDVMSTAIVVIPDEMSLQSAARILNHAHVSGAPVVNNEGRCVGILSAADFVKWMEHDGICEHPNRPRKEVVFHSWDMPEAHELPTDEVHTYMTPEPVTTKPFTTVGEMARMMVDAEIHRIIVVDPTGRPIGLVSSTDLLAVLARACKASEVEPTHSPETSVDENLVCSF
jgi:CBS-domain-containing membrane protein